MSSRASARNSGVKSMRSSIVTHCRSYGAGFVGTGCVGDACSPSAKGAFAAGEVVRRRGDGQVNVAPFVVPTHHGPDVGGAEAGGCFRCPGVVAELARLRNRMEGLPQGAGMRIEAAYIPDDDDMAAHDRRRRIAILAIDRPA